MTQTQKVYQGEYLAAGVPNDHEWTLTIEDHDWKVEVDEGGTASMVQQQVSPGAIGVINALPPHALLVSGDRILIPAIADGSVTDITWNGFETGFTFATANYDTVARTLTVSAPVDTFGPVWPGTPWESGHTRRDEPLTLTFQNAYSAPPGAR